MKELKPCPFCGSEVKLIEDDGYWGVQCQGLKNLFCDSVYVWENKKRVIDQWNDRIK